MTFYCNPFGNHRGFYFESAEELEEKLARAGIDEYEIDFSDGTAEEYELAKIYAPTPSNIQIWIEAAENADAHDLAAYRFLSDCGFAFDDAIAKLDNVSVSAGDAEDYAQEFVEDVGLDVNTLRMYADEDEVRLWLEANDGYSESDDGDCVLDYTGEVCFEGTMEDFVEDVIKNASKKQLEQWLDYEKFARDLERGGDVTTVRVLGDEYTITNASDF